jgi:hypothetical protein
MGEYGDGLQEELLEMFAPVEMLFDKQGILSFE